MLGLAPMSPRLVSRLGLGAHISPPTGPSSFFYLFKLDLALESCSNLQFLFKASLIAGALTSSLLSASLPTCVESHTTLMLMPLTSHWISHRPPEKQHRQCVRVSVCVHVC